MERCRYLDYRVFFEQGAQPSVRLLGYGYLLRGARQSGKTSLAFQAAINTVLSGGRVVVMCCEALLYAKLPQPFRSLSTLPEEALNRIEFIYVDSWTGVMAELTRFVDLSHLPTLLIIDDDGFPLDPNEKVDQMAICLSYLHNISDWARRSSVALHGTPAPEQQQQQQQHDLNRDTDCSCKHNHINNHSPAREDDEDATATSTSPSRDGSGNPDCVFYHVVVTNRLSELLEQRLPLPYAAFPMVDVCFRASAETSRIDTDGTMNTAGVAAHRDNVMNRVGAGAAVEGDASVTVIMTPAAIDAKAVPVTVRLVWSGHLCLV